MRCALELTKTNRLRLARAFRQSPRVDYAIDCVVEGQMGRAFADDPEQPSAFGITVGPFWYFAGDAGSLGGAALLREWPAGTLLMPSPPDWIEAAQAAFPLEAMPRYRFSAKTLAFDRLMQLFEASPCREAVTPLDAALVARLTALPDSYLEIEDFDSAEDFLQRGLGYAAVEGGRLMGVAYSSLVCSHGIEVSVYVEEPYRQRGVATALASRLLLEGLRLGLRPNWDAANPESGKLALKLGYTAVGDYEAYYRRGR